MPDVHRACAWSWHLAVAGAKVVRLTALVEEDIFAIYSWVFITIE